jgi:hypothetical protein
LKTFHIHFARGTTDVLLEYNNVLTFFQPLAWCDCFTMPTFVKDRVFNIVMFIHHMTKKWGKLCPNHCAVPIVSCSCTPVKVISAWFDPFCNGFTSTNICNFGQNLCNLYILNRKKNYTFRCLMPISTTWYSKAVLNN